MEKISLVEYVSHFSCGPISCGRSTKCLLQRPWQTDPWLLKLALGT